MSALILHPEIAERRRRVQALRAELSQLFNTRVAITFELFPELRRRYGALFGDLEQELQTRTLELSERKRMVELFALKLDRGQKLDRKTVELVMKAVRGEFMRVRTRMREAFASGNVHDEIPDAYWEDPGTGDLHRSGAKNARRRIDEIREIYRHLAKRLHPDCQQGDLSAGRLHWDMVQDAYRRHDLPLLRTLQHLIETLGEAGPSGKPIPPAEENRLRLAVRGEQSQVEKLMSDPLYQMRDQLLNQDEVWRSQMREQLQNDIAAIEREMEACDAFLAPILSGDQIPSPDIVKTIWSTWVEDIYINSR